MKLKEAINIFNILINYPTQAEIAGWDVVNVTHFDFLMWVRNTLKLWPKSDPELVANILALPDYQRYLGNYRMPHEKQEIEENGIVVNYGIDHPDNLSHVLLRIYVDYLNGKLRYE